MGIFKSYDIRGVWGREWDATTAYRIGRSLPSLLEASDILVGRDARESSPAVFQALARGILEAGCDVTDLGLATTPSVYFATAFYRYGGSVMITASHNPPEYNGLKISRAQAIPVDYGSGLEELERLAAAEAGPARAASARKGKRMGGTAKGGRATTGTNLLFPWQVFEYADAPALATGDDCGLRIAGFGTQSAIRSPQSSLSKATPAR